MDKIPAQARSSVLIDCCPMLGGLTLNSLLASDRVLMPVSADYLSLESINKLSFPWMCWKPGWAENFSAAC